MESKGVLSLHCSPEGMTLCLLRCLCFTLWRHWRGRPSVGLVRSGVGRYLRLFWFEVGIMRKAGR